MIGEIVVTETPEAITKYMENYWQTYDRQIGYKQYANDTVINDALYGIGAALNPAVYSNADGYRRFKAALLTMLESEGKAP